MEWSAHVFACTSIEINLLGGQFISLLVGQRKLSFAILFLFCLFFKIQTLWVCITSRVFVLHKATYLHSWLNQYGSGSCWCSSCCCCRCYYCCCCWSLVNTINTSCSIQAVIKTLIVVCHHNLHASFLYFLFFLFLFFSFLS